MQHIDIKCHEMRFAEYVSSFDAEHEPMLRLKVEHTAAVVRHARRIADSASEQFSPDEARALVIAAQYHDIARFPQFRRWRTFKDALSTDHGSLGCRILRRQNLLHDEPALLRRQVRIAVCLHNKLHLPSDLAGQERLITEGVRDADKLDIFRVMARYLTTSPVPDDVVLFVKDEPDQWTPAVVETVLSGQVPSYNDLVYLNDFRMVLVSWLHDLHFAVTRRALAQSGEAEIVLAGLPETTELKPVISMFRDLLRQAALC